MTLFLWVFYPKVFASVVPIFTKSTSDCDRTRAPKKNEGPAQAGKENNCNHNKPLFFRHVHSFVLADDQCVCISVLEKGLEFVAKSCC